LDDVLVHLPGDGAAGGDDHEQRKEFEGTGGHGNPFPCALLAEIRRLRGRQAGRTGEFRTSTDVPPEVANRNV
jgi:hypothetical protein